eukprot:6721246-Pyramimonas_sp.AAC.1
MGRRARGIAAHGSSALPTQQGEEMMRDASEDDGLQSGPWRRNPFRWGGAQCSLIVSQLALGFPWAFDVKSKFNLWKIGASFLI